MGATVPAETRVFPLKILICCMQKRYGWKQPTQRLFRHATNPLEGFLNGGEISINRCRIESPLTKGTNQIERQAFLCTLVMSKTLASDISSRDLVSFYLFILNNINISYILYISILIPS